MFKKNSSYDLKLSFFQFIDSLAIHMTEPPPCTLTFGGLRKLKTGSCHPAVSDNEDGVVTIPRIGDRLGVTYICRL